MFGDSTSITKVWKKKRFHHKMNLTIRMKRFPLKTKTTRATKMCLDKKEGLIANNLFKPSET